MKKITRASLTGMLVFSSISTAMTGCTSNATNTTNAANVTLAKEETSAGTDSAQQNVAKGMYNPGDYTGTADGFGGKVTVTITTNESSITEVLIDAPDETPTVGGAALDELTAQIKEKQSPNIDGVSGATITSNGVRDALKVAISAAKGEETSSDKAEPLTFKAGTYTGTANGYNGPVTLDVTFSDDAITDIVINSEGETAHIGTPAYDIVFEDAIAANGSGVDGVSGATFTSRAIKEALNDAAEQAGVSNIDTFKSNTVEHKAQEAQELSADVIIVGAGGAGMAAAAEAAMNGKTVLMFEQNAEIGGNTLAAGGQFQAVMDYLCWDKNDPEATEAVWDYDGKTYEKVKAFRGEIATLRQILDWNEAPFDEHYFDDKEYVAGEIDLLSQAGVHQEYLPTLKALKEEIRAYLDYAEPKLESGVDESELTLFSTVNLHIFQTYYGGLRHSADGTKWIYGDFDLVSQLCNEAPNIKTWLEEQGSVILDSAQRTLVGAIWYRANRNQGADMDGDGEIEIPGNWGSYFVPLRTTLLEKSETASDNSILLRTTVDTILVDETGKVNGVVATRYDGTQITAHANDGVILATGGYAANVDMVVKTNNYWDPEKVTESIKTTNRSSLVGSGIEMAEEIGADTTGMEYTQMMPISWIDNGNLAYGSGQYAVYINPTTGKRFVDEFAERDVLSLGEFANGISYNGVNGVFLEITNGSKALGYPYHYDVYDGQEVVEIKHDTVDDRVYFASNKEELQEILDKFGMEADPEVIYDTIKQYDEAYINKTEPADGIKKSAANTTIGTVKDDGTYVLDGEILRIRIMAPSTHHTMGGLVVDTERHVLDKSGQIISGLYAAGEVTGGIHAGNRLGGNAISDVLVSGKIAADTIVKETK